MFTPTTQSKAAYTLLESRTRRTVQDVAQAIHAGKMGRRMAYDTVAAALRESVPQALTLGRDVGMGTFGSNELLLPGEARRAAEYAETQCAYLRAWLLGGGPLVPPGRPGVGPRLDLYALSIHGAYQTGLALGLLRAASKQKGIALLQEDPVFLWVRSSSPGLDSCPDCKARAARSQATPYTLVELMGIGFPGGGGTRCLSRCRCHVEVTPALGGAILSARAHRRAKPTAYHGVVSPDALATAHPRTVGPGQKPGKSSK